MTVEADIRTARRIFVSYSRADRARIVPLTQALERAGHTVWWDQKIDGGSPFAQTIEQELENADAVLVAWSKAAVASDWVRDEGGHARDRHRLVAITLDGIEPPLGFRQYHAIDFASWNGRDDAPEFHDLLRSVAAAGDGSAPVALRAPDRPGSSRRKAILGGGAALVAAGAAGLLAWRPWQTAGTANSVAVLPFATLSGDPAQAYFSDGLAEEIRAPLARNPALKVAAPTSAGEFRDRAADFRSIAKALDVAFVLEGSVRKGGDVARVVATLIDAHTGFTSWTQTFDRKLADILAVQSEIANTVEGALSARMGSGASAARGNGGTTNVAAYDAFLKGRALFDSDTGESSDRGALARFDAAIAADPGYAAAYAARSHALAAIASQYGKGSDLRVQYLAAIVAAKRATALAPNLAAAHLALGYATFTGLLDARAAKPSYDRAAALGQGDADVLVLVATYQSKTGQFDEALRSVRRARTLDPLNPRTYRTECSILIASRKYSQAIAAGRRALAMGPKLSTVHAMLGAAYLGLGDVARAKIEYAAEPVEMLRLAGLAVCAQRTGDIAAARAALAQIVASSGDAAAYQQAQVLAQMGRRDEAIAALQRAYTASDGGLTALRNDAMLDPLRRDPRFVRLLGELGMG